MVRVAFLTLSLALFPSLVFSQSLDSQLQELDELREEGAFDEAHEQLEALREEHPENVEVLWRLAWVMTDVGERIENSEEQKQVFLEADEVAEEALSLDGDNARVHLSKAVAAGRAGLVSNTRQKVRYSRTVKDHVDRAIELDPDNDLAYHLRGRWNHEVASLGFVARTVVRTVYGGLPDASYERAKEDLEKAIAIRDRVGHRLELGRTLLELGEEERAHEQFQKAIEMPSNDPHDLTRKRQAHELLRSTK